MPLQAGQRESSNFCTIFYAVFSSYKQKKGGVFIAGIKGELSCAIETESLCGWMWEGGSDWGGPEWGRDGLWEQEVRKDKELFVVIAADSCFGYILIEFLFLVLLPIKRGFLNLTLLRCWVMPTLAL